MYKLCIDEEIKLNPQIKKRAAKNEKNCIFARSFKGFRRKDDNLYDLSGCFEPQIIEPSLFVVALFLVWSANKYYIPTISLLQFQNAFPIGVVLQRK